MNRPIPRLAAPALVALLGWAASPGRAQAVASPRAAAMPFIHAAAGPAAPAAAALPAVDSGATSAADPDSSFWRIEPSEVMPESASVTVEPGAEPAETDEGRWLRAPFGDRLLTAREAWAARDGERSDFVPLLDYNRVDPLRLGFGWQLQEPRTMNPRIGARIEYAFGRDRVLYGVQFEQPVIPPGRVAFGVSMVRRTDHSDLQQVEDAENTLALLMARQDYRDYFEREGLGAYLSWWVPDFSTVSVHVRSDRYRSLEASDKTRSWFHRGRDLRPNPPADEGEIHGLMLRLERLAHQTRRTRAGLYHWIEVERAGRELGGNFEYTRGLADVRSVIRLSPAATLTLRGVAGHTFDGVLPVQKQFTVGGVDGLRAHAFAQYRGDQMALAQAEYSFGLWRLGAGGFDGGLHFIAFVDAGRVWSDSSGAWEIGRQRLRTDGGFGLGTSEDHLRVYVAKNLQEPDSDFLVSVRLQRPF